MLLEPTISVSLRDKFLVTSIILVLFEALFIICSWLTFLLKFILEKFLINWEILSQTSYFCLKFVNFLTAFNDSKHSTFALFYWTILPQDLSKFILIGQKVINSFLVGYLSCSCFFLKLNWILLVFLKFWRNMAWLLFMIKFGKFWFWWLKFKHKIVLDTFHVLISCKTTIDIVMCSTNDNFVDKIWWN